MYMHLRLLEIYGGPKGRAMRRCLRDNTHVTVDDFDATIDGIYVTIDDYDATKATRPIVNVKISMKILIHVHQSCIVHL